MLLVAEAGGGHGRRRGDGHDGVADAAHRGVVAELPHRPLGGGARLVGHRQHRDRAPVTGGVQQVEQHQVVGPPVVQEQDDGVRHRRVTGHAEQRGTGCVGSGQVEQRHRPSGRARGG